MDPVISFAALEEQISLLREATDAVLLDTIGLGQKMHAAQGEDRKIPGRCQPQADG